jgi:hypothetical protein
LSKVGEFESIKAEQINASQHENGGGHTLKVGHKCLGTRVKSIDDHFAVSGSCNFDAAILEARCWSGTHPGRICADMCCLRREVELGTCIDASLGGKPIGEQLVAREMRHAAKREAESAVKLCRSQRHKTQEAHLLTGGIKCPVQCSNKPDSKFRKDVQMCRLQHRTYV